MAAFGDRLFPPDAPVLWFGPRAHAKPGPRNQRLWLLWPAWAWRVAIPGRRDHSLNLLQRTALSLAYAGVNTSDDLGARMGLHRDLAHLVAMELFHMGLLGADGRPTSGGRRRLEAAEEATSATAAWVFQDPFSGETWPRAEAQLQYADRRIDAEGRTELVLGDAARPWHQRVVPVHPEGVPRPSAPDSSTVLNAARSHRRARRRLAREEDLELFQDDDGYGGATEAVSAAGVSFIEERPQPVWLTAFCYFPEGSDGDNHWYVTDPFGLGPSDRLRSGVERRRSRFPPLRNALARFLGDRAPQDEGAARDLAILEVERRYGVAFRSHPAFDALVEVHTALAAGDRLTTMAARAAYAALRRALEEAFAGLAAGAPWQDIQDGQPAWNRAHLGRCADEVDLGPLPRAVLKVQRGQVRAAANGGGGLRPRIAAAVLNAARNPSHPLRSAARTDADILCRVDELADAAGEAVHQARFRLERQRLNDDVATMHRIFQLLGLSQHESVPVQEGLT